MIVHYVYYPYKKQLFICFLTIMNPKQYFMKLIVISNKNIL
ncbi:hypothetical protein [Enterococcus faecium]|nr:hypothetical protein [Enterococcus faecium]